MTLFSSYLIKILRFETLSESEAEAAMRLILAGEATQIEMAAFLVGLPPRDVTPEAIFGFAKAMRSAMLPVDSGPGPVLDTCGTGGDGANTFNISTVAAFVVAGAGVRVAKHGNRSASSMCGSADVMEALGVRIELTPEQMGAAIREVGVGFLFARLLHPALRHAALVRSELRVRTVLNMMGPLCNPASASGQLIGVPSEAIGDKMAATLARFGEGRQLVVHGSDGLDEITPSGMTTIWNVENGQVSQQFWHPKDFGMRTASLDALRGGNARENAAIALKILGGEQGPMRDVVVMNAAAGLMVAGAHTELNSAVARAEESIDSGAAMKKLIDLAEYTQGL